MAPRAHSTPWFFAGAVAFAVLFPGAAAAQSLGNTFGGMSENPDAPIDIQSDTLTVYDNKKLATFLGNVKAVQGTTTLRARKLDVHYIGGANKLTGQGKKPPEPRGAEGPPGAEGQPGEGVPPAEAVPDASKDGPSQIKKIEAKGSVVITSGEDQTTTSDWAIYDVPAQLVTIGGNVVLSQDQNVLKGDRLVIDLNTGESRFENTGTAADGDGRIRALFLPKEDGRKPSKKNGNESTADDPAKPAQ